MKILIMSFLVLIGASCAHKTNYLIEVKFPDNIIASVEIDSNGNGLNDYECFIEYKLANGIICKDGLGTYLNVENFKEEDGIACFDYKTGHYELIKLENSKVKGVEYKIPVIKQVPYSAKQHYQKINGEWFVVAGYTKDKMQKTIKLRISRQISNPR